MLAEQARDVRARWRQRVVQARRDDHLDDGLAAPAECPRVAIGPIHVTEAGPQYDAGGVMIPKIASRQRREARQLRECDVDAERAGAAAPSLHATQESRLERVFRDHLRVKQLRIDIGSNRGGADEASVGENNATRPALLDHDLPDRRTGFDLYSMTRRRPRHRLRDRTHSTYRMPPDPFFAIQLAEGMMQEHVRRARRVRAGVVSDNGVETEPGLHELAFKPTIEIIGSRFREKVEHRAQIFRGKPTKGVAEASRFD